LNILAAPIQWLFDKDTTGEEEGVFKEAKAALHMLLGFVLLQQTLGWVGVFIQNIGGQNEATMALLALGLIGSGAFQGGLPLISPERVSRRVEYAWADRGDASPRLIPAPPASGCSR
jgi:hypothetical protein